MVGSRKLMHFVKSHRIYQWTRIFLVSAVSTFSLGKQRYFSSGFNEKLSKTTRSIDSFSTSETFDQRIRSMESGDLP